MRRNVVCGTKPGLYLAEPGGAGQRAQAAAAPPWNAALPSSTADSLPVCLGRGGLAHSLILKAASFRVFLLCGSKESLSWRNCCQQKEALFKEEKRRPAWGRTLNEVGCAGAEYELESSDFAKEGLYGVTHMF